MKNIFSNISKIKPLYAIIAAMVLIIIPLIILLTWVSSNSNKANITIDNTVQLTTIPQTIQPSNSPTLTTTTTIAPSSTPVSTSTNPITKTLAVSSTSVYTLLKDITSWSGPSSSKFDYDDCSNNSKIVNYDGQRISYKAKDQNEANTIYKAVLKKLTDNSWKYTSCGEDGNSEGKIIRLYKNNGKINVTFPDSRLPKETTVIVDFD